MDAWWTAPSSRSASNCCLTLRHHGGARLTERLSPWDGGVLVEARPARTIFAAQPY